MRGLSPHRARTFYNLADALVPAPGPAEPGAGDVDLVPALEAWLAGAAGRGRARRVRGILWALEWQARLRGRLRGFSWLSRDERRALWRRWERSRLPPRRRAAAELTAQVHRLWRAHSAEGA